MSKRKREAKSEFPQSNPDADRTSYTTIAFNIGLLLFVLDGFWFLMHGPSDTATEHRLHALLFYTGFGTAVVAWVVESSAKRLVKLIVTAGVSVIAACAGLDSVRQFDLGERALLPGTVKDGRVTYDGLGVSFDVPADWQLNLTPTVTKSSSKSGPSKRKSRVQYGETAVFFQAATIVRKPEASTVRDSIQVEGGPFHFRSLGRTLASIQHLQRSYESMAGVKTIEPMRYFQIGNLDFAEFQIYDENQKILYQHVFARSGENRLDFVLTSADEKAPPQFEQFIRSIRISRQPTRFND